MAVDETGLTIPTVEDLLSDIESEQQATIGVTLIVEADEPLGQINGIFASKLREAWEAIQVAFNALDPDAAEGSLLDALSSITGTIRRLATFGKAVLTCNLDEDTELIGNVHSANVAGDGDNRWVLKTSFTAPSDGDYELTFLASEPGAVQANAGTITEIATPVTGWNSVTNTDDATPGINEDTDEQLRARRLIELSKSGSSTTAAIRSEVSSVSGVVSVSVTENDSPDVDINGLPPHSIEVLVFDGPTPQATDDDIAQAIYENRCAGVATFGTESGNATTTFGDTVVQNFNRPESISIYIAADYVVTPGETVSASSVETAIVNHLQSITETGSDVYVAEIAYAILTVDGVRNVDLSTIVIGDSFPPVSNNDFAIGLRQIADYDTGRTTATEV